VSYTLRHLRVLMPATASRFPIHLNASQS
jgi:hypothetical protein